MPKVLLTLDVLIPWLRRQPADGEYIFQDPVYCMMGRFLADHGSCWGEVMYSDLPDYEVIAGSKPWTFGAALKRAEVLNLLPPPESKDELRSELPDKAQAATDRALVPL